MLKEIEVYNASESMPLTNEQRHILIENIAQELLLNHPEKATYSIANLNTFVFAMKDTIDGRPILTFWVCPNYLRLKYELPEQPELINK